MADVKKIRVYVVSSEKGPAKFKQVFEGKNVAGQDYREIVELAPKDGSDPVFHSNLRNVSVEHISKETASQDGLNIKLGKEDEPIAIVICLPQHDEANQWEFREEPIIELGTNSETGETFIDSALRHDANGYRWASFVCDPKKARVGKLAECIRALPDKVFGDHKGQMRIPFTYNIRDKQMKFAPWVLSDHSHAEEGNKHSDSANFTHGGVHPYSSYYLTIDL